MLLAKARYSCCHLRVLQGIAQGLPSPCLPVAVPMDSRKGTMQCLQLRTGGYDSSISSLEGRFKGDPILFVNGLLKGKHLGKCRDFTWIPL